MKVASAKYEVDISVFAVFMPENVYMYQTVFYDHHFISVSFTEILTSYGSSVRSWTPETGTPTDPTGPPQHKKNHLDEVQARSGTVTHQEIYVLFNVCLLYCTVWLMMY